MSHLVVFSPAKINLFLAITGRRPDGFHDLLSVAVPLMFGDTLWIEPRMDDAFSLTCDDPDLTCDETNLVMRAARAFREATGRQGGASIRLTKQIPAGAGLGGGSSNATSTLLGLNTLAGCPLNATELSALAVRLGSDCALFLQAGPVVMRGRGEYIQALEKPAAERLSGRRLLIFKPNFGIKTTWAYQQMIATTPKSYLPSGEAETRLGEWLYLTSQPAERLVFNNMEAVAFGKYLALPTLLEIVRERFGVTTGMSGSGSACFALLKPDSPVSAICALIRDAWGETVFIRQTEIR